MLFENWIFQHKATTQSDVVTTRNKEVYVWDGRQIYKEGVDAYDTSSRNDMRCDSVRFRFNKCDSYEWFYYSSFTSYYLMFERDNGQFFVSLKHVKG